MKYVKMVLRVLLGIFMTYAGVSHLTIARQEFRDFWKDVLKVIPGAKYP